MEYYSDNHSCVSQRAIAATMDHGTSDAMDSSLAPTLEPRYYHYLIRYHPSLPIALPFFNFSLPSVSAFLPPLSLPPSQASTPCFPSFSLQLDSKLACRSVGVDSLSAPDAFAISFGLILRGFLDPSPSRPPFSPRVITRHPPPRVSLGRRDSPRR